MKQFFAIIVLISLFSCKKDSSKESVLLDFVPNTPSVVISASDITSLQQQIKDNIFIDKFNKTTTYKNLRNDFLFCDDIKSTNEILISYATVGKSLEYLFAIKSKNTTNTIAISSDKRNYNNTNYNKLKNQEAFTIVLDSTLVVTSSEILLENLIRNKQDNIKYSNKSLKKLNQTNSNNGVTIFINSEKKPEFLNTILPAQFLSNTDWMSVELNNEDGLAINGIATNNNTQHYFAKKLLSTSTGESNVSTVIPSNFSKYTSYNFDELTNFNSEFEHFNELIDNSTEVASFNDGKNILCAFKLLNTEVSENLSEHSLYRNNTIYKNTYFKIPATICKPQPEFACYLDDFILLSNSLESLQNCISHYQNETTLENQPYFKENSSTLLREAHVVNSIKTDLLKNQLSTTLKDESINSVNLKDFPLAMYQTTYEENYIQFNSVIKKVAKKNTTATISQIASATLDANLATNLQWVTNHRTKQKELLVQDINNVLYLISNKGAILWKKQLEGKIQGDVKQVDLFKNRKLQLAFTTENEFLILDRNGKVVDQFHKKFKDGNLLPLSVFDYDNNRNYRFIITQGEQLHMYDNKFKLVKGFKFTKVKSAILQEPMHVRIGTKDYIAVAEQSGKLHILNRKGEARTKINSTFSFDNNRIVRYKNSLVFKDKNKTINSINIATGKVKKLDILQGGNSFFNYQNNLKVKLEDNNLTIKSNTIELDFGNYTAPELFYINNKYYISTTDIDTQKVYMFDSNAKLLDKFPVYGQSTISLTNMDKDAKLEFAVKGESNSILIYKMY